MVFVWLKENWFSLSQVCGIVAGMLFTALTIRQESRRKKIGDLLTLNQQHQELWKEIQNSPALQRLLAPNADLVAEPVGIAEEEFLNRAFVHFYVGWLLIGSGALIRMDVFAKDVRAFFSLPVPQAVWDQTKAHRDVRFVRFVDGVLRG